MESLPVELLLMIIEEAKKNKSLKTLRCVNRLFCSLIEPIIFETILFDSSSSSSYDLLKTLADRRHFISTYVRSLTIRCFDRHFSPSRYYVTVSGACQAHECQRLFDTRISRAVRSLKGLSSLKVLAGCDSISPASVWSALRKHDISLKQITVSAKLDRSFIDYLLSPSSRESGSGIVRLEDLAISRAWSSPNDAAEQELADLFYHHVLPRHRETLQTLTVTAAEEGPWSMSRVNLDEVGGCTKLRELRVSVNSEDVGDLDPQGDDVLTSTLSMSRRLPHLTLVSFSPAESKRWGSSSWGTLAEQHEPHTISRMVKRILGYDSSEDASVRVEIDGQVYMKKGDKYLPCPSLEAHSRRASH